MTPDAVVFDFDGVLANTEPLHLRVYQMLAAEHGFSFTTDEYYGSYLGFDDVGVFEALSRDKGLRVDGDRMHALIERKTVLFQSLVRESAVLFPGTAACLRAMRAACPIAIASGALSHEITLILASAGLDGIVPVIVAAGRHPAREAGAGSVSARDGTPERSLGRHLRPEASVAIEDSRWGLESARDAGMLTVALTTSYAASGSAARSRAVGHRRGDARTSQGARRRGGWRGGGGRMNARLVDEFRVRRRRNRRSPARPALVAARIAYPKLDPSAWLAELDVRRRGATASRTRRRRQSPTRTSCAWCRNSSSASWGSSATASATRIPQQLPQRRDRAAHRHPDHAGHRLHGNCRASRPDDRRRELPRSLPDAVSRARPARADRAHRRSVQRRRRPERRRLPEAAEDACRAEAMLEPACCSRPASRPSYCGCC